MNQRQVNIYTIHLKHSGLTHLKVNSPRSRRILSCSTGLADVEKPALFGEGGRGWIIAKAASSVEVELGCDAPVRCENDGVMDTDVFQKQRAA